MENIISKNIEDNKVYEMVLNITYLKESGKYYTSHVIKSTTDMNPWSEEFLKLLKSNSGVVNPSNFLIFVDDEEINKSSHTGLLLDLNKELSKFPIRDIKELKLGDKVEGYVSEGNNIFKVKGELVINDYNNYLIEYKDENGELIKAALIYEDLSTIKLLPRVVEKSENKLSF